MFYLWHMLTDFEHIRVGVAKYDFKVTPELLEVTWNSPRGGRLKDTVNLLKPSGYFT
jgi:hypothetical protein